MQVNPGETFTITTEDGHIQCIQGKGTRLKSWTWSLWFCSYHRIPLPAFVSVMLDVCFWGMFCSKSDFLSLNLKHRWDSAGKWPPCPCSSAGFAALHQAGILAGFVMILGCLLRLLTHGFTWDLVHTNLNNFTSCRVTSLCCQAAAPAACWCCEEHCYPLCAACKLLFTFWGSDRI